MDWEIRLNLLNPDRRLVAELPCNIHPLNPLNPVHCSLPNFPISVTSVKSRSRVRCRTSFLTLLDYQVRGFLVQRHTLKLSILAAILKPNTRPIEPSIEPNLDNPRGLCLPKRLRITSHVPVCPTVHLIFIF